MAEKVTYELKANVTSGSIALPTGKTVNLGAAGARDSYTTSDWQEQQNLDAWDAVKRVDASSKKKDGDQ